MSWRTSLLCLATMPVLVLAAAQGPADAPTRASVGSVVMPIIESRHIPGVVVAIGQGDRTVLLEAFGVRDRASAARLRTDDLFQIGSLTKQFTATLLAQLVNERRFSLDDAVGKHLDRTIPLPTWASAVTLRQLANHTSGLPRNPVNRRNEPDSPSVMLPYSRRELYQGLATTTLASSPGTTWSYSNLGFALLGEVIERTTGQSFERALRTRILDPLDMRNTGVQPPPALGSRFASGYWPEPFAPVARPRWSPGEVVGFASMYSSAPDLLRFLAAQTQPGAGAALRPAARAALHTPTVTIPDSNGARIGLAWFVNPLEKNDVVIDGIGDVDSFSAAMGFVPRTRASLVILVNRGGDAGDLYDALLPALVPFLTR